MLVSFLKWTACVVYGNCRREQEGRVWTHSGFREAIAFGWPLLSSHGGLYSLISRMCSWAAGCWSNSSSRKGLSPTNTTQWATAWIDFSLGHACSGKGSYSIMILTYDSRVVAFYCFFSRQSWVQDLSLHFDASSLLSTIMNEAWHHLAQRIKTIIWFLSIVVQFPNCIPDP